MLSQDQVDFYRANGYLIVADLLRADELTEANAIVDDFVERSRQVTEQSGHFDLESDHSVTHPKVRRLIAPASYHPFFDSLMRDDRVLDALAPLIGPAIRAQGDKLNMKSGDGGSAVEWHQDFAHYPHSNDDLCAVSIALGDARRDNGCMMVVPGSHKEPILDHHQDGVFVGAVSPARDGLDLEAAVPLEMTAGSLAVHHARTLHGSAPNHSGRSRRLLLYQYAAVDAWPLAGVGDWDAFNSQILRGELTYEFRLSAMAVRTRLPAGPRSAGGIYELQKTLREKVFTAG